jgi:hypothetical protein
VENYWKYINSDGTNISPASKEFEKDGIIASSTVIFGTEEKTVHLGYYKYDNGLLHWYDQHGNLIENVDKWNYLPTDAPADTFRISVAKGFVSALDKMGY